MQSILTVENLRKDFGAKTALKDVSFDVEKGSICGLLGPNGAGKTTLLRIVNSILIADAGSVKVNGEPVSLKTTRYFGYMPEERGLYDKMRVEDQILFFGKLKGGDEKRLREVMREYLDLFRLTDDRRRRIKELSKGNQQKVQIISTIVHEPEIVILDEPFSGFDPINGAILQELISRLHEKGMTVILSSHNMPAIEEMCNDIALINRGSLLIKDSISNIKENHKDNSLLLTTSTPLDLDVVRQGDVIVDAREDIPKNGRKGFAYKLRKNEKVSNLDVLDMIAMQSNILHFEEALPSLTDIFMKYTADDVTTSTDNN